MHCTQGARKMHRKCFTRSYACSLDLENFLKLSRRVYYSHRVPACFTQLQRITEVSRTIKRMGNNVRDETVI